jgi:lysophospholipase L1-like esterase
VRFLALGDSYTIGEGVQPAERWPVQLAARLTRDGVTVEPPEIIAATGWTTAELEAAIDRSEAAGPYDLVSLLIGVNNQYRGLSIETYATEFERLLKRAVGFTRSGAGQVIVLSIPDWGVTAFAEGRDRGGIATKIDEFNRVVRAACERSRVAFVDVTAASREAGVAADMLAADGLHPSARQYALWAGLALPPAKQALRL